MPISIPYHSFAPPPVMPQQYLQYLQEHDWQGSAKYNCAGHGPNPLQSPPYSPPYQNQPDGPTERQSNPLFFTPVMQVGIINPLRQQPITSIPKKEESIGPEITQSPVQAARTQRLVGADLLRS